MNSTSAGWPSLVSAGEGNTTEGCRNTQRRCTRQRCKSGWRRQLLDSGLERYRVDIKTLGKSKNSPSSCLLNSFHSGSSTCRTRAFVPTPSNLVVAYMDHVVIMNSNMQLSHSWSWSHQCFLERISEREDEVGWVSSNITTCTMVMDAAPRIKCIFVFYVSLIIFWIPLNILVFCHRNQQLSFGKGCVIPASLHSFVSSSGRWKASVFPCVS